VSESSPEREPFVPFVTKLPRSMHRALLAQARNESEQQDRSVSAGEVVRRALARELGIEDPGPMKRGPAVRDEGSKVAEQATPKKTSARKKR
jgi:hypothetical protein